MANIQNSNQIKKYKTYVLVFFIAFFITTLSYLRIYICPFNFITGIPCPLCGMTRALFSAVRFNFSDAFYFHALWPIPVIVLPTYFLLKMNGIKINKKLENIVCIIIGLLFIVYYILRHIYSSPIVEIHTQDSFIYYIYQYLTTLNIFNYLI